MRADSPRSQKPCGIRRFPSSPVLGRNPALVASQAEGHEFEPSSPASGFMRHSGRLAVLPCLGHATFMPQTAGVGGVQLRPRRLLRALREVAVGAVDHLHGRAHVPGEVKDRQALPHPGVVGPEYRRPMARRALTAALEVAVAVLAGVAFAALFSLIREGSFSSHFTPMLWLTGALMLLMALLSLSPSTQTAQDSFASLSVGRLFRGGQKSTEDSILGMTLTLALGALGVFAVAALVG